MSMVTSVMYNITISYAVYRFTHLSLVVVFEKGLLPVYFRGRHSKEALWILTSGTFSAFVREVGTSIGLI